MKAVVVKSPGGFENLSIIEKESKAPKSNEVKVRWHATSLNYHDFLVGVGGIPVLDNRIPMSDGAGEIIEIGSDVHQWKVGDKVMSMFFPGWVDGAPGLMKIAGVSGETIDGYIAEESNVPASGITRMPEGYSYGEAATLPCAGLTAWNGLMETGRTKPGDTVLIEGTGGMSMLGFQFAKAAGAKVIATTSSESKAEKLKAMGADMVVNYREDPKWGKTIFRATGGADIALDVGGGSTMGQTVEALKIGGKAIAIGILSDGRKGSLTFPKLFFKFINIHGIAVGSRVMQENMVRAIEQNEIKPDLDKSFAFDQLADAFRYQASGQHFGKIVLEW